MFWYVCLSIVGIIGYLLLGYLTMIIGISLFGEYSGWFWSTKDLEGEIPDPHVIVYCLCGWPFTIIINIFYLIFKHPVCFFIKNVRPSVIWIRNLKNLKNLKNPKKIKENMESTPESKPVVCECCHQQFYKKGIHR